ncbi:MAG TPA: ROK family protein [Bryobacteraceae bacterium]|jgi:fructokinase|nr:ROK family protein [Bryobacteraceae bacterium]
MQVWGAIEAGGSKFVCGTGTSPRDFQSVEIPTLTPDLTIPAVVAWFEDWLRQNPSHRLGGIGIGSFGPIDINLKSPTWGFITSTPKAAWRNFDFALSVRKALKTAVQFNSDVNAAILGEARWGAARGLRDCLYLTIGTGIGGGALSSGDLLQGVSHPEMGHIRVPRDLARDPFPGICPYHGDCLEGLASGPAIEARWGLPPAELPASHPAWILEAEYLACAIANFACTFSPQRVLLGGGVMRQTGLFEMIRPEVARLLGGYVPVPEILPPELGERAGVLGALALAIG